MIDPVEHLVAVLIVRAAGGVHRRARRRVGALIDPVQYAVAIGIGRAAAVIDGRAAGSVGAGVTLVCDAVVIRVCRRRGVRLEERESRGRHEVGGVLRPAGKRTRRARGVDAARLESQRQTRAHEELRSRSAVESAVGLIQAFHEFTNCTDIQFVVGA